MIVNEKLIDNESYQLRSAIELNATYCSRFLQCSQDFKIRKIPRLIVFRHNFVRIVSLVGTRINT